MNARHPLLAAIWTVLKWILIVLGIVQLVMMAFSLWFFGVIPIRFLTEQAPKPHAQFAVTGFSPTADRAYLEFAEPGRNLRIGWKDLQTSEVFMLVPKGSDDVLAAPHSSSDGKKLAVVIKEAAYQYTRSQIGILDLDRMTYRPITRGEGYKQLPSFSRDGRKIIYAQSNRVRESGRTRFSQWDFYETDVETGAMTRLTEFCFFAVDNPFYLADGERFIFSGEYPSCNFPSPGDKGKYDYYVKIHRENTIFLRTRDDKSPLTPLFYNGETSHSPLLTDDGRIFFISRTNEMDGIKVGNYNYDLFVQEHGNIRRLTNLQTFLTSIAVSPAGDIVAYESDKQRNQERTHWILQVQDGTTSELTLGDPQSFHILEVVQGER